LEQKRREFKSFYRRIKKIKNLNKKKINILIYMNHIYYMQRIDFNNKL
jgi:hypothetical protein